MTAHVPSNPPISDEVLAKIGDRTIADLVEHAPGTLTIFSVYGLDTCCGGGLPLREALSRHGIEAEPVIAEVAVLVSESQDW